jgi:hypothetical protein
MSTTEMCWCQQFESFWHTGKYNNAWYSRQQLLHPSPHTYLLHQSPLPTDLSPCEPWNFGRHGYPDELVTDNGAPWNGTDSHSMQQYLKWAGIKHRPTRSADDPEANGLAERFMQSIGNAWATSHVEDRDPAMALNAKLKMYRNTEHSVY